MVGDLARDLVDEDIGTRVPAPLPRGDIRWRPDRRGGLGDMDEPDGGDSDNPDRAVSGPLAISLSPLPRWDVCRRPGLPGGWGDMDEPDGALGDNSG